MTDRRRAQLVRRARLALQESPPKVGHALELLRQLLVDLDPPKPAGVPSLGPVVSGGRSILLEDLTHATDGVPGYPAFDTGVGRPGLAVLAPEALTVTRLGRFVRRDGRPNGRSVYATGRSTLRYVFGHLEQPVAVGTQLRKGSRVGVISSNHEAPHLHLGIDARPLLGRELEHHLDYTHGSPPLGEQLAD